MDKGNYKDKIKLENVDPELKKMVRIRAVEQGITMREYIIRAMEEKLEREK